MINQDGSQLPKGGVNIFKKYILNSTVVIIFIFLISTVSFAESTIVDVSNLDKGLIKINHHKNTDNMKILITKGNNKEHYDLKTNVNYPLQFGNGQYSISILEHVNGNQYRPVNTEKVNLKLNDGRLLYLQSIQIVNWDENMLAIKKAKELTKNAKTEEEKIKIIYDYITNNIKYDNKKAKTAQVGYIPSIDATLKSQSGICYDYGVLTAAMLRSVDIPTKLIMGYKSDITEYHAWNQVYLNGKWITIDTTYDAEYVQKHVPINMIKNEEDYKIEKIY